jgi:repressor LexA
MKDDFVPRRADQIITFVDEFINENGYSPSVREIADGIGLASPGSVQGTLQQMIKLGYLTGAPERSRTIRIGHMPLRPRTEVM